MTKELALLLPDELFTKLQQEATYLGTSVEQLAADILEERFSGTLLQAEYHQPQSANDWTLWQQGEVRKVIYVEKAYVASWDAKTAESQKRLQKYLADVSQEIGDLLKEPNLFLHMDIAVSEKNLLSNHDIENYLTPLVKHLGAHKFVFVSGRKYIHNISSITIGTAERRITELESDWKYTHHQPTGSSQSKEWKSGIRDRLMGSNIIPLPKEGEVEVILAWKGSPRRNWVSLWKPTGDAMGPVLGYTYNVNKPFYPNDDRITYLECHWFPDETLKHKVEIGMWWRSKP